VYWKVIVSGTFELPGEAPVGALAVPHEVLISRMYWVMFAPVAAGTAAKKPAVTSRVSAVNARAPFS
jgi:hypothetical protein